LSVTSAPCLSTRSGTSDRVAALEAGERRYPGLYFHGNAYHNAGVPELVSRSGKLARRMAEEFAA
jgi:hypothetical protein